MQKNHSKYKKTTVKKHKEMPLQNLNKNMAKLTKNMQKVYKTQLK